jgi:hypothetical protein
MTDREVDVLAPEVRQRICSAPDIQIDLRMPRENLPIRGSSQRAANDGMTLTRSCRGLARSVNSRTASPKSESTDRTRVAKRSPSSVKRMPRRALDQTNAEVRFQRFDLMADRAVGEMERFGGASEATHPGGSPRRAAPASVEGDQPWSSGCENHSHDIPKQIVCPDPTSPLEFCS